jgi:hypothetical protein
MRQLKVSIFDHGTDGLKNSVRTLVKNSHSRPFSKRIFITGKGYADFKTGSAVYGISVKMDSLKIASLKNSIVIS